jgi:hypothetical protein
MEEFTQDTEKTSKYNSAFDQLRRIGVLWQTISIDVRNGNYLHWNINLDRLWMELVGDLDENSDEEKKIKEINKKILAISPLVQTTGKTFNKISEAHIARVSKQYLILVEKEIFLRRLQNKQGKGTAWKDESEDDFE